MEKLKLLAAAAVALHAFTIQAQTWTDVTECYINNPNMDKGYSSWATWGDLPNPPRNDYNFINLSGKSFYMWQDISDLVPGKYRLSLQSFYRHGTAAEDYSVYIGATSLSDYEYYLPQISIYTDDSGDNSVSNDVTKKIPCLSSAALEIPLEGTTDIVNGNLYVPKSYEAIANWFNAGYYVTTINFDISKVCDASLSVYKGLTMSNELMAIGEGFKLEYSGDIKHVTSFELSDTETTLVPTQYKTIHAQNFLPKDATFKNIKWMSDNESVVTISNDGVMKAVALGEATITAVAIPEGKVTQTCHVTVVSPTTPNDVNLIINEMLLANIDTEIDPSWNYGSCVELYNPSNDIVGLDRLYVTDDTTNLTKCAMKQSSLFIPAKGHALIWFDHHDDIFSPSQIDMKLKYNGGTLYITDGVKVVTKQDYPQSIGRASYARTMDGGDTWSWTPTHTLNKSNSTAAWYTNEQVETPTVDEDGGTFTNDTTIHIRVPEGTFLTYTLDGSTPKYNSANIISADTTMTFSGKSAVIRLMAHKKGCLSSEVLTRTYIYKDKNYVFPIMAVTSDRENLFGEEYGIFVGRGYGNGRPGNGKSYNCNWNADWERPANFEYITDKGEYVFNQEVDISSCGGWSRSYQPHSFKLKAAKYYNGLNSMDYQFFSSKPYQKHKTLQIRNGGNDNEGRIKDAAIQEVVRQSGINVHTQAWQPVHVFINGEYNGVMNMREPNNKHYAYSNYGYDTDSIDQFEMSPDSGYVQKAGTIDKYLEWYTLSENADDPETYEKICEMVDIDEYINYVAVEMYIKNWDWPQNNVKGFRSRNDGKFHFVLFDTEQFNSGSISNPLITFAGKQNYTFDYLYGTDQTPWKTGDKKTEEIKFVTIFLNMLKNEQFRKQFIDVFCINGGSVFANANVSEIVKTMRDYMNTGMKLTNNSSSSSANSVINAFTTDYQKSMATCLAAYKPMNLKSTSSINSANFSSNIAEGELFINDIKVPTGSFLGKLYLPATIKAVAPAGYKFLGWSKFKFDGSPIINTEPEIELTSNTNYLHARWEKMTEEEMIANNVDTTVVVINEVSAANDVFVSDYFKKSDWLELYNTTDQDVDIRGMYLTDNINKPEKYQIPEDDPYINTIIPAHGYKVIWCDKKDNKSTAIHASFKLDADSGVVMLSRVNDSEIVFSDTLRYVGHEGTESFGRFPDGYKHSAIMSRPTPGSANICDAYVLSQARYEVVTGVEQITEADENGLNIVFVGDNRVNIKSNDGNINTVTIYTTSGALIMEDTFNSDFETINLNGLPHGMYVMKVTDDNGNMSTVKFVLK